MAMATAMATATDGSYKEEPAEVAATASNGHTSAEHVHGLPDPSANGHAAEVSSTEPNRLKPTGPVAVLGEDRVMSHKKCTVWKPRRCSSRPAFCWRSPLQRVICQRVVAPRLTPWWLCVSIDALAAS